MAKQGDDPNIFSNRFSLGEDAKISIIRKFWPHSDRTHAGSINVDDYRPYFDFFHKELRSIPLRGILSQTFAVCKLEDIITVVEALSKHQAKRQSYVIQ